MVVMRIDPEQKKLLDIFKPYMIYQYGFEEPYILSNDAPVEAVEANKQFKKLVKKEKEIDEQWMF